MVRLVGDNDDEKEKLTRCTQEVRTEKDGADRMEKKINKELGKRIVCSKHPTANA